MYPAAGYRLTDLKVEHLRICLTAGQLLWHLAAMRGRICQPVKRYRPEDQLPLRSDTHESILPPVCFFFRAANTIFFLPLPGR